MSNQRSRVDEDDDLDDLDDVLDQFSPPPTTAQAANAVPVPTSAPTSTRPAQPEPDALSDDFAAEFAKGMASLFDELGIAPDGSGPVPAPAPGSNSTNATAATPGKGNADGTQMRELAAAWEAMLVEEMNAMADPTAPASASTSTSASASTSRPAQAEADFQSRIRSTVDRLRERESELQPPESGTSAGVDPLLAQLMGGLGGDGTQSEEQLQETLEAMMRQLMGKDVLYEPLKELYDKFPSYLTENAATISPQDKARYEAQIACIKRLIDEFESSSYHDDDEKSRAKIVELMGELQAHGQPPEEIMGPLPPGFSMGADGLPEMPDGCNMN